LDWLKFQSRSDRFKRIQYLLQKARGGKRDFDQMPKAGFGMSGAAGEDTAPLPVQLR
jgi:hypothetical protein